ncbi:50S ribosomal protein L21 [Bartonella sp. CB175]|uniref:50S ribosomal protein L21 n=1 Tax=Bartonella sp. CB175 TaxID=3112256 RepID=UPI00300E34DB
MFAVIKTGGKQYRVIADQLVKVEKITGNVGDVIEFKDVLMVCEGDNVTVGTPVVSGAVVTAKIIEQGRLRKVISFKKRRRQNSKRTRGHRQEVTTLRVLEVLTGSLESRKTGAKSAEKKVAVRKETKASDSLKKADTQNSKAKAVSEDSVITSDK